MVLFERKGTVDSEGGHRSEGCLHFSVLLKEKQKGRRYILSCGLHRAFSPE
jgi:hypothetical protein